MPASSCQMPTKRLLHITSTQILLGHSHHFKYHWIILHTAASLNTFTILVLCFRDAQLDRTKLIPCLFLYRSIMSICTEINIKCYWMQINVIQINRLTAKPIYLALSCVLHTINWTNFEAKCPIVYIALSYFTTFCSAPHYSQIITIRFISLHVHAPCCYAYDISFTQRENFRYR